MTLSFLWKTAGPVSSVGPPRLFPAPPNPSLPRAIYPRQAVSIVATHSFADAPRLDILLVPGGIGNRYLNDTNDTAMEDFVAARYPELQYLLSVCTGAATLAKSGVLAGKRATTNKAAWAWATSFGGGKVQWVPSARWTEDGNIWTSSGVSAGIDMTYAFFKMLLGEPAAAATINGMEYTPHVNKDWDPYSVVFQVSFFSLLSCQFVRPARILTWILFFFLTRSPERIPADRWGIVLGRWDTTLNVLGRSEEAHGEVRRVFQSAPTRCLWR